MGEEFYRCEFSFHVVARAATGDSIFDRVPFFIVGPVYPIEIVDACPSPTIDTWAQEKFNHVCFVNFKWYLFPFGPVSVIIVSVWTCSEIGTDFSPRPILPFWFCFCVDFFLSKNRVTISMDLT